MKDIYFVTSFFVETLSKKTDLMNHNLFPWNLFQEYKNDSNKIKNRKCNSNNMVVRIKHKIKAFVYSLLFFSSNKFCNIAYFNYIYL